VPSRSHHWWRDWRTDRLSLDDCIVQIDAWSKAALAIDPEVIVLCHGGPIAMPNDASYVLERTADCHGFYGARSMERLPTEVAIREQIESFRKVRPPRIR